VIDKIYIITDLGPGDGGKGGVVHKVCNMTRAYTVIKTGGAQGSHGVRTSRGEKFNFSQWGCGTFDGVKTHLSNRIIVSPEGLLNEANALRFECGIHNPFDLLTLDSNAICATPYHGISSRLKEMALKNKPRGTIGTGIGETFRYSQKHPELIIRAGDLASPSIKDRLVRIRIQIQNDLQNIISGYFFSEDQSAVGEEVALLFDDGFLEHVAKRFLEVSKLVKIVSPDYLAEVILKQEGTAVVESSHGILTDNVFGFYPHASAIRTLPVFTHKMLREAGFPGRIVNIGVTRAYAIRHGAGPFPTDNPAMVKHLLPGSNKDNNRYQGKVRVGPLDFILLKYAIEVCGGCNTFDGLAITWFDQIQANKAWHLCYNYQNPDQKFFTPNGAIKIWQGDSDKQQKYQEELGQQLLNCVPEITTKTFNGAERDELFALCADTVSCELGIPVRIVGFGPTESDKMCK